jgi:hypothetical protein
VVFDSLIWKFALRQEGACNFTPLIPPDGPAPAALASLLAHPEPQNIGKKQMFRDCSSPPPLAAVAASVRKSEV